MKKEFVFVGRESIKEYYETIKNVQKILDDNRKDWQSKYFNYCDDIYKIKEDFIKFKDSFKEWKPFTCNVTISSLKKGTIDLRFKGRTVGILKTRTNSKNEKDIIFTMNKKIADNNCKEFNYKIKIINELWNKGTNTKDFRAHFKNNKLVNNKIDEHRHESMLVSYFENKKIRGLKPLKIFNKVRFAMNTPICASDTKNIKYSPKSGGGIDILARYSKEGTSNLTIIEVKDKNESGEPPQKAMKQAISYTVFIRELLRAEQKSERKNTWWKLFGYKREFPKSLHLNVAIAMPFADKVNNNGENVYFKDNNKPIRLKINDDSGDDILELHYIYYKEDDGKILEIETSFSK